MHSGVPIAPGRGSHMCLEHALKMALIGKAQILCRGGQVGALAKLLTGLLDTLVQQPGVRGQPGIAAEQTNQLIAAQPILSRQFDQ